MILYTRTGFGCYLEDNLLLYIDLDKNSRFQYGLALQDYYGVS